MPSWRVTGWFGMVVSVLLSLGAISCSDGGQADSADGDLLVDGDGEVSDRDQDAASYPAVQLRRGSEAVVTALLGEEAGPFSVRVLTEEGDAVVDRNVVFEILRGPGRSKVTGASLTDRQVPVDSTGLAQTTLQLEASGEPGTIVIQARDEYNLATPLIFRVMAFREPTPDRRALCVLSINDFHMRILPQEGPGFDLGGLARIAALFKSIRSQNEAKGIATLIVNAGDDFENTLFHNVEGTIPKLYQLYDAMGVDVVQVGNHDYHFGVPFLDKQVAEAEPNFTGDLQGHPMVFLWGNVDPTTLKPEYAEYRDLFEQAFDTVDFDVKRYNQTIVMDLDGLSVGMLGVTTDASIYTQVAGDPTFYTFVGAPTEHSQGMTFFNPDPREHPYINQAIDSLDEEGADLILVASHAGLGFGDRVNIPPGKDEHIARNAQGIESGRVVDAIISAHSHVQLNHAIQIENPAGGITPVLQAGEAGHYVGAMMFEVDTVAGMGEWVDSCLIQVDATLPEDPETAEAVAEMTDEVVSTFGDVFSNEVGEIPIDLGSRERAFCALGQVVAESFLWKLEQDGVACDVAMSVPSIYRADLRGPTLTESEIYDVVPLHVLDERGLADEPILILEMVPGIYDWSVLNLSAMSKDQVSAVEFVLELVYSIEMLDQLYPSASTEFNLEVMHLAGMNYMVDYTAEPFRRVVSESLRIADQPIQLDRAYRLAMVHSLGMNLSYIFNFLVTARDTEGNAVQPLRVFDVEGEEIPYQETTTLGWEALRDYLEAKPYEMLNGIPAGAVVLGDWLRSRQPDPGLSPSDIRWEPTNPRRGDSVEITITLHNFGETPVGSAEVDLFVESTPWDLTDNDDAHLSDEGFEDSFSGSLINIGSQTVSLPAYPELRNVVFGWEIPSDWPPSEYPLQVRIHDVVGADEDPNTGVSYQEVITGNNDGQDQSRRISIKP